MRRKKHSSFPFISILLLCLLLFALVGLMQKADISSLSSVLAGLLPAKEAVSASDGLSFISSAPSGETDTASGPASAEASAEKSSDTDDTAASVDNCYAYYYQQISSTEKQLYQSIYTGVSARTDTIELPTTDTDTIHRLYHFVLYDHPELFWCIGSSQSNVYSNRIEFMPDYSCTAEEITSRKAEIEQAATSCLTELSADASDYEKVRFVYTWLVNNVDYDQNASDNQNIYSSMVGHASVCAGYAKGMQYLLSKLSVPCIYITGTLSSGGTHAWNMVQCNGKWYQVDATFGDPVFQNTQDIPEDNISYAYLCCTDAQFNGSHRPDEDITFPVCNSIDLNYYVQNGWFIFSYDHEALKDLVAKAVTDGKDGFTLQCANSATYKEACTDLLDTIVPDVSNTYMQMHNLRKVRYKYSQDGEMLVFTLYWTE